MADIKYDPNPNFGKGGDGKKPRMRVNNDPPSTGDALVDFELGLNNKSALGKYADAYTETSQQPDPNNKLLMFGVIGVIIYLIMR